MRALESRVLGGSWVVISGVLSRVTILITHIGGLITPLITTHEPPSIVAALLTRIGLSAIFCSACAANNLIPEWSF